MTSLNEGERINIKTRARARERGSKTHQPPPSLFPDHAGDGVTIAIVYSHRHY